MLTWRHMTPVSITAVLILSLASSLAASFNMGKIGDDDNFKGNGEGNNRMAKTTRSVKALLRETRKCNNEVQRPTHLERPHSAECTLEQRAALRHVSYDSSDIK